METVSEKHSKKISSSQWTPTKLIWTLRLIYIVFTAIPAFMTQFVFSEVSPLTPKQVNEMFLPGIVTVLVFHTPVFLTWVYLIEKFKNACYQVSSPEQFEAKSFKRVLSLKRTLFLSYIPLNVIGVVLVSVTGVLYLIYVLGETDITLQFAINFILSVLAFVLIFILFALSIIEHLTTKFILVVIDPLKIAQSDLDDVGATSFQVRSYFVVIVSSVSITILIIGGLSDKLTINEMGAIFTFLLIYLVLSIVLYSQIINPVVNLQGELKKLVRGELISGERVFIQSFDEIGTLAQLYNLFLDKFYGSLHQLQEEANRLNQIIFHYQVTFDSVMSQIADINSSLGTYSTSTQEIADNTQVTSEFLNNLVKVIEEWAKSILNLSATFKDITTQIRILSLNTAIEAARDGQSRSGFAVIARHIQESSSTLQKINREIVNLTRQLQEQILQQAQEVKTSLEENVALIEENASQIEEITATLEEITAMVDQLRQQTEEIAHISKQLSEVVAQYLSSLAEQDPTTNNN